MTENKLDMDAGGKYDYLLRSISIVTLLVENGVLQQLFEQGVVTQEEVDQRVEILRTRYPEFVNMANQTEENHPATDVDEGGVK